MKQTCKPGSVIRRSESLSFICDRAHARPESAYPLGHARRHSDEPPLAPTYLAFQPTRFSSGNITVDAVSSYLTISPLPYNLRCKAVSFLWHCLFRNRFRFRTFPLGSVVLYAARTFLPRYRERQGGLFQYKNRGFQVRMDNQFASSFLPKGVITDSGWNCMPYTGC